MKWYTINYYNRVMWRGQRMCLDREDFAANTKRKRGDLEDHGCDYRKNVIKNFNIALAVMILPTDYNMPEGNFLAKQQAVRLKVVEIQ